MKPYLFDVNVLIALAWPNHVHHRTAQEWFARRRTAGFRTCPLTQVGFVRVSCLPAIGSGWMTPANAGELLRAITAMPEHGFWACDVTIDESIVRWDSILGHRQLTDAYLLGLARVKGGVLATLDRAMLAFPDARGHIELLLP